MVLTLALHEPKVAQLDLVHEQPDPVEWLEKLLQVDFASSPEILRISVSGKDQEALLVLVAAIRDVYLREIVNAESKERDDHLQKVQRVEEKAESAGRPCERRWLWQSESAGISAGSRH
jgi:hypothetical protein